jgi:hypothetical protein
MSTVLLLVDVERAVRTAWGATDRVRERHVLADRTVHLGVTDASGSATRTCGPREWRAELENLGRLPATCPSPRSDAPEPDLPWELLVATGRALGEHRRDLYDELLDRSAPELRPTVRRLHQETVGRLRLVGTLPTRRRVGWVSWVLLPDGWRALVPYLAQTAGVPRPMVRLEPRRPEDLVHEVARWTAQAWR